MKNAFFVPQLGNICGKLQSQYLFFFSILFFREPRTAGRTSPTLMRLSCPFTLLLHLKMSLRNAIINLRTDTRKLAFFSFFSHICPWPLSFFVRLNKWRVFPDLLLYFCVLRSARIGYNTALKKRHFRKSPLLWAFHVLQSGRYSAARRVYPAISEKKYSPKPENSIINFRKSLTGTQSPKKRTSTLR